MKIAAVICEYNPMHKGHEYQLNTIRNELSVDYIVLIMSGDFVERGEPAIYSKELRAKMALNSGADLVLMLPTVFSTGAADLFAYGAVSILNKLNYIDYLVFGAECDDLNKLKECAGDLLINGSIESPSIKELLKDGNSFAKARALLFPEYSEILNKPNNILAISYLQALKSLNSKIEPYLIKRQGADYNENSAPLKNTFASATYLRKCILNNEIDLIIDYVPPINLPLFKDEVPLNPSSVSEMLFLSLLNNKDNLSDFLDVSDDLSNKIKKALVEYKDLDQFIDLLKTKDLTYSRISRALLHILLSIKGDNSVFKEYADNLNVVRIIGLKKASSKLVKGINENGDILISTKIPDTYSLMNDETKRIFEIDENSFNIYNHLKKFYKSEYTKETVIN